MATSLVVMISVNWWSRCEMQALIIFRKGEHLPKIRVCWTVRNGRSQVIIMCIVQSRQNHKMPLNHHLKPDWLHVTVALYVATGVKRWRKKMDKKEKNIREAFKNPSHGKNPLGGGGTPLAEFVRYLGFWTLPLFDICLFIASHSSLPLCVSMSPVEERVQFKDKAAVAYTWRF